MSGKIEISLTPAEATVLCEIIRQTNWPGSIIEIAVSLKAKLEPHYNPAMLNAPKNGRSAEPAAA